MLLSWHNLRYYGDLMRGLRHAIGAGTLDDFVAEFHATQARGDAAALAPEGKPVPRGWKGK